MTAAATQATPSVPPRPSRGSGQGASGGAAPKIPPRPFKNRPERSMSPNSDRFAPSPLHEGIMAKPTDRSSLLSPNRVSFGMTPDPIERSGSVDLPSVGQEGMEYSAIASEVEDDDDKQASTVSPEQTRTVGEGLELHAPKPSLPANSAKARVQAVTRTDSDRAASFGFGRPTSAGERNVSRERVKKRPSTSFSASSDQGQRDEDENGIPEIGQRVPMNPELGDVQAPSPGPPEPRKHHHRKHSSRGLPPGSYGLHGHGVGPQDKLEKAYYEKHPELIQKEEVSHLHDRQNDFSMSREELNKLVRESASRGAGFGTAPEIQGAPTDEVAFQASDEYVRQSSPRPSSSQAKNTHRRSSSLAKVVSYDNDSAQDERAIHVDDARHSEYRSYGDEEAAVDDEDHEYTAPILAADEVQKNPNAYLQRPAVHPPPDRRHSSYENEDAPKRPVSRGASLHKEGSQPEIRYTPLEDVEEYEPLFNEETKKEQQPVEHADENKHHNHFPSKDIWEDAPSSVHHTATVNTPDLPETEHHRSRSSNHHDTRPMTPAHAFALHQEELAERESKRRSGSGLPASTFLPLSDMPRPTWAAHQAHLKVERPASGPKFPSRDVWEDVPESQLQQTIITSPEEEKKPEIPSRPAKKPSDSSERPAIPTRPKPRTVSSDDAKAKPPVSDKPKPQIPARPAKSSSGDSVGKEKPPVPSRPAGGKIAALQAGFMSDLNKRLKIGPQVHKEAPQEEQEAAPEKEKAPLSDARKGRARGPQRRAPPAAKSPAPVADEAKPAVPTLSFSMPLSSWSINDEGTLAVSEKKEDAPETTNLSVKSELDTSEEPQERPIEPEPAAEPEPAPPAAAKPVEPELAAKNAKIPEPDPPAPSVQKNNDVEEPARVEKTLVANMAGESVLEATVDKKNDGNDVDPVEVDDAVKP